MRAYRFDGAGDAWVLALVLHHPISDARSGFFLLTEVLLGAAGVAVPAEAIAPRPALIELVSAGLRRRGRAPAQRATQGGTQGGSRTHRHARSPSPAPAQQRPAQTTHAHAEARSAAD
ncbi:MAG: hypothetical protein MZV49_21005 [Rhodopseudomonas palustris]|nr:hypothetical protein [Rhodopseudomonas palustris]